jgi:phage-related protein
LRLHVIFYRTELGNEPVREWLRSLPRTEKKVIGEDIKTVQFGWPLGMPLVRKVDIDVWEVRSQLENRTARVLFTVHENVMVLLHGFIKKSEKLPARELRITKQRLSALRSGV